MMETSEGGLPPIIREEWVDNNNNTSEGRFAPPLLPQEIMQI